MPERARPVAIPMPVAELVEAWNERSADRFAAALAPDVHLQVPPLHLDLRGREEARYGVAALFAAFGALRYTSRHRYLTSEGVTDEALLEGMQTREFLGAPPTGRPAAVAARVMMRHDGRYLTSLTVWPDVGALRNLSDGVARRIDLRAGAGAASVVASLRATLPSTEGKLSLAHSAAMPQVELPEPTTLLPGAPDAAAAPATRSEARTGRKDGPKAPMPRKARRRRAIAAGVLMLALTAAVVAWIVDGVGRTKDVPPSAAKPSPTVRATTAKPSPSPSPAPSTDPSPSASFNGKTNTYTFTNAILFPINRYRLRPDAQRALDQVVAGLVAEKRYGVVQVTGYTDDTGSAGLNRSLSERRAQAVKQYLVDKLSGQGDHWQVQAEGLGEEKPLNDNSTEAERELNRRVEIKVPDKPKP
ncbi:MAG TPA: OmpA family protein [Kineosporiaceae bacterium]|nr:OmpA family protein [Kineosporiaceae bacterium]